MAAIAPFYERLSGSNAFYKDRNYLSDLGKNLCHKGPLPTSYSYAPFASDSLVVRIIKTVWTRMSTLIAKVWTVPALLFTGRFSALLGLPSQPRIDLSFVKNSAWKPYRFTCEIDGRRIDCMMVGKPEKFESRNWSVFPYGSEKNYEQALLQNEPTKVCHSLGTNALLFNYPGTGDSDPCLGPLTPEEKSQILTGMLSFVREKLKAKIVIVHEHPPETSGPGKLFKQLVLSKI